MIKLPKVKMSSEALEHGKLYIWSLPHGENKVVWLSDCKNCLCEYDPYKDSGDPWFFEDNLCGELFGPFELNKQPGGEV